METRRKFIKRSAILTAGALAYSSSSIASSLVLSDDIKSEFWFPKLNYGYKDLEPHIDALTMEIHHTKHHQAYVNNLNKAIETEHIENRSLKNILHNISQYSTVIRNNAGGHYNHSLFWKLMKPNGGGNPSGQLLEVINSSFGSVDNFKTQFSEAAKKVFGSGWAWLVVGEDHKLKIGTTPNQDNPLMDVSAFKGKPILALDVWEHAYYLKHQNKRIDYINSFWNVVNWEEVQGLYGQSH